MNKIIALFIALMFLQATVTNAKVFALTQKSDTAKVAAKKPNMGYKYNKQHHLKADGTPSKLYKSKVVDTAKRKG